MTDRSLRTDVRNPLCLLPAAQELCGLPEDSRKALKALLRQVSADARLRADKCWKTHKAPMAAYWKAVAAYANHAQRLLRTQP